MSESSGDTPRYSSSTEYDSDDNFIAYSLPRMSTPQAQLGADRPISRESSASPINRNRSNDTVSESDNRAELLRRVGELVALLAHIEGSIEALERERSDIRTQLEQVDHEFDRLESPNRTRSPAQQHGTNIGIALGFPESDNHHRNSRSSSPASTVSTDSGFYSDRGTSVDVVQGSLQREAEVAHRQDAQPYALAQQSGASEEPVEQDWVELFESPISPLVDAVVEDSHAQSTGQRWPQWSEMIHPPAGWLRQPTMSMNMMLPTAPPEGMV